MKELVLVSREKSPSQQFLERILQKFFKVYRYA